MGSGRHHTIGTVIEEIIKLTNSKSRLRWGKLPTSGFEPKVWQADLKKIKRLLGWEPKHRFETGISKTIDWFRENLNLYF